MSDSSSISINRKEWLAALSVALFTAVLGLLPYWLGAANPPEGQVYMHLIMNAEDSLTYWAKMLQGLDGAWQYTIPFTPEPHDSAAVGVFYVWLGQVARLLTVPLTAVWHGARFVAAIILFMMTFWFTAVFLTNKLARWTGFLLALFGSGFGWLLFISGQTYWLGAFPIDFKQPGAHLFFTALTFPHISLGTALILFDMLVFKWISDSSLLPETISEKKLWRWVIVAGLGNLMLGIAYPFLIYIVALTAVILYLYLLFKARKILWSRGFQIATIFLIPAPLYLYYLSVWQTNEVFHIWDVQAGTPSPPWPHYLVGFGLMLLLALIFWWKRPSRRSSYAVLFCWLTAVALLIYAPLGPQRRFVQGVHVGLSILATAGLLMVVIPRLQRTRLWQKIIQNPRYNSQKLSRFIIILFLLMMSLSNFILLADVSRVAGLTQPDLFFRTTSEVTMSSWLRENEPEAIILGDYQTGNLVAATAGNPVMLGHWAETVDFDNKVTAVSQFFSESASHEWRQTLLADFNIGFVWYGPREKELGGFDPETAVYLHPIHQIDNITLYAVQPNIPHD